MRLRPLLAGVAVAAALLAVMVLGSGNSTRAASAFNPTTTLKVADPTPGNPSDFTGGLNIANGDVQFAAVIAYIPQQWGIVTGDHIPAGAGVGTLSSTATLGLVNGACNTPLPVVFDMQNGSLNMKDTVAFEDTDASGTPDFAKDANNNGLFDAVDKYPDWLTRIFKDASGAPLQPIRRSIGVSPVAGIPIILQFLIFPPGTQLDAAIPHDPAQGFPSVTVLENVGDHSAIPAPSIINDFCTPLTSNNLTLGKTTAGDQLFVNPSNGAYSFGTIALGQRDADGDGYENTLDTCPLAANVGNPRIPLDGDLDGDGLDSICDPSDNATTGTNSDQDGDGYQNRNDNCALIANGEAETGPTGNQKDTDLDGIGDACDPNPTTADTEGTYSVATPSVKVTIGTGGTGPGTAPTTAQCQFCWNLQTVIDPSIQPTLAASGSGTPKPSGSTSASGTPKISASPAPSSSSSSSNTGTIILIVVGIAAAVIVIGGGAALLMRRKKSV